MSEIIFRHYRDAEGLNRYLTGTWSGTGMHGYVDWPEGIEIRLSLRFSRDTVRITARKIKKAGLWERFRTRISKPFAAGVSAFDALEIRDLSGAEFEADIVRVNTGQNRFVLQAMTEKKCHFLLEKNADASLGRPILQFSGVLIRG